MNQKNGNIALLTGRLIIVNFVLIVNFLTVSCTTVGTYPASHRFKKEFTVTDTSAIHSIDIFARLPFKFSGDNIGVVVDIVIPQGTRYSDTLQLPVKTGRFQYFGINSGRWRDMRWSYRENIKFQNQGLWRFYIRRYPISPDSIKTGEIGFIINRL